MTDIDHITTDPFDDDKLHEECGVYGIFGHEEAAPHAALGLHALQHRGQEACGIVSFDGQQFHTHKGMGLVGDNFSNNEVMDQLKGHAAIGHVRYATTGGTVIRNVQPLFAELELGGLAIAHNGNLTNTNAVRKSLIRRGCIFQSDMDTEIIVHLVAISLYATVEDRLIDALRQIEGAYSLVAMTKDSIIGVRDPNGVRPLALGKLGDTYILASESCAFDITNAQFVRDVEPGEIVVIDKNGVRSIKPFGSNTSRFCVFEYIYFARPDSIIDKRSVYSVRKSIGAELARENGVEADMVVPVPDSGVPSAIGYAAESGIPFELGIIRNHYVGRTFIAPTQDIRNLGVRLKHNANTQSVKGKRIILVDDSIVRGTTSKKIVDMMRQAGASEVHMRIASPPTSWPCFYGINTPKRDKLLAAEKTILEMAKLIGADSLDFITIDGMYRAVGEAKRNNDIPQFCDACFTGQYPTRLKDEENDADDAKQSSLPLLAEQGK
jgi:amidophosphoribosyltransferase